MNRALVPLIALGLLHASCVRDDGPVSQLTSGNSLSGVVYDANGSPVENVGVHYLFETRSLGSLTKPTGTSPSTTIGYTIPTRGHVTLRILRWYTRQPVDTLVDQDQDAGSYRVLLDATHVTNGIYVYQILTDSFRAEQPLMLLNTDLATLVQAEPLTTSDSRGTFSLPYGVLGFAAVMHVTDPSSPAVIDSVSISTSIQLVLFKEGYQPLVRPIVIDTTQAMSRAFTLSR